MTPIRWLVDFLRGSSAADLVMLALAVGCLVWWLG